MTEAKRDRLTRARVVQGTAHEDGVCMFCRGAIVAGSEVRALVEVHPSAYVVAGHWHPGCGAAGGAAGGAPGQIPA